MSKLVAKGAEADVYEGKLAGTRVMRKIRKSKAYRVKALDEKIRLSRTRKEARLLHSAKEAGVRCPLVLSVRRYEIAMSKLDGRLMMKVDARTAEQVCASAGTLLATLHSAGISHGDYTPANIVIRKGEAWIIDFGLGEFTLDDEDFATDILLMKKSLSKRAYSKFKKAYCRSRGKRAGATLERLVEIEKRGRYVVRGALA